MSMKIIRRILYLIILLIMIIVVFFAYPKNYKSFIRVNNHYLNDKSIDGEFSVLTFGDINLMKYFDMKDFKSSVDLIAKQKSDVIIFTGDLVFKDSIEKLTPAQVVEITTYLKKLKPMYGKFAVTGEQDNELINSILVNSGFEIINNQNRIIRINNVSFNLITPSDDTLLDSLLVENDMFQIIVTHNPIILDKITSIKYNIFTSGHTLGGQYNLPLFGTIYSDIKDNNNIYRSNSEKNIYISNGLGTIYSDMRFDAPAEINIFKIN